MKLFSCFSCVRMYRRRSRKISFDDLNTLKPNKAQLAMLLNELNVVAIKHQKLMKLYQYGLQNNYEKYRQEKELQAEEIYEISFRHNNNRLYTVIDNIEKLLQNAVI